MDISITSQRLHKILAAVSVLAILSTLFVSVRVAQAAFSDVASGAWYASYAEQLQADGVISGVDGKFLPDKPATRAELSKMLVIQTGLDDELEDPETPSFTDLPKTHWAYKYVETAKANEILGGYGGDKAGKVGPDDTVLREQAAKMIVNAWGLDETVMSGAPHFSDVPESHWAYTFVESAYAFSVTDGDPAGSGMYKPGNLLTRAALSKMVVLGSEGTPREEVAEETPAEEEEETPAEEEEETPAEEEVAVPTAEGTLEAAVAASSPAASTIPDGSSFNTITVLEFTASADADVQLKGLTLARGGFIGNTGINQVSVWDAAGKRHGNIIQSLTSDGKATVAFTDDPIVVPAGGSVLVTVKIGLGTGVDSGTVNMGVASAADITSSAATVQGTFPVVGATHSVVNGASSLGSYTASNISVGGGANSAGTRTLLDSGEKDREFLKIRLQHGNAVEDLEFSGMRVFVDGTVSAGDVLNFRLLDQDGLKIAEDMDMDSQKYVDLTLASPTPIPQGTSRVYTVVADVSGTTNNASRTIDIYVRDNYDIMVKGKTSGAFILDTATTFPVPLTTASNWFEVRSGALSISKASDSASGFVPVGADNIVFGKYNLKASGENIEIQKLDFRVFSAVSPTISTHSTTATQLRGTVRVALSGTTLYSIDAATAALYLNDTATTGTTLSSYGTVKVNAEAALTVEGNLKTDVAGGTTYVVRVRGWTLRALQSNTTISSAVLTSDSNVLTTEAGAIAVSPNGAFAPGTIVVGVTNAKIGSYKLQAGSAEDFNISSIQVKLDYNTSADLTNSDTLTEGGTQAINNLKLMVGDKQYGTIVTTPNSTGDTISTTGLKLMKNDTVVIDIYADISSAALTTKIVKAFIPALAITATGTTSNTSLSPSPPSTAQAVGNITLASSGVLNLVEEAGTPVTQQVLHAAETDMDLFKFRIKLTNAENILLQKVTFTIVNGNGNVTNFKLLDGAGTQVGGVGSLVVPVSGDDVGEVKFTGLNKTLTSGDESVFSVKGTVTGSGVLTPGKLVRIEPSFFEYTGVASGTKTLRSGGVFTAITRSTGTGNPAELTVSSAAQFERGDWVRLDLDGDGVVNEAANTTASGATLVADGAGAVQNETVTFCLDTAAVNSETPTTGTFGLRPGPTGTNGGGTLCSGAGNYAEVSATSARAGNAIAANHSGALTNANLLTNAGVFVSRDQIVHDVEPVMVSEGTSGTAAPSSTQEVYKLKLTASGSRPLSVKGIELLTGGSYSPWTNANSGGTVTASCTSGGNATFAIRAGAPLDRYVVTVASGSVTVKGGGGSLTLETYTSLANLQSGTLQTSLGTVAAPLSKYVTFAQCSTASDLITAADYTLAQPTAAADRGGMTNFEVWIGSDKKSVQGYVFSTGYTQNAAEVAHGVNSKFHVVDLSTVKVNSGTRLLFAFGTRSTLAFTAAPILIPASGSTTFIIKADTSNVRAAATTQTVTANLKLDGDPGLGRLTGGGVALNATPKTGGLHWDYSNVNGVFGGTASTTERQIDPTDGQGTTGDNVVDPATIASNTGFNATIDVADSYPVVGPTWTY